MLVLGAALLGTTLPGATAGARSGEWQPGTGDRVEGRLVALREGHTSPGYRTFVESRTPHTRLTATPTNIQVTYHGFSTQAKTAFAAAVNLWSRLVQSKVPIKIDATWTSLGSGLLGQAGADHHLRNFPGAPQSNTYYPAALADSKAGQDLSPGDPDVVAEFNSGANWYLGTDGNTPISQTDFVSVVLHEIGHGLGFAGYYESNGTQGYRDAFTGFDRYISTSGGTPLANYSSGTTALGSALESPLRYTASQATFWYGGPVPLYAPSSFESGSSVYHLDENAFDQGDANSLMTPFLNHGEAIYDPGEVAMGVLRSMGWSTTGVASAPAVPTLTSASVGDGKVDLVWKAPADTGRSRLSRFVIKRYPGSASSPDQTIEKPATTTSVSMTGLTNGTAYKFTIAAANGVGAGPAVSTGTMKPFALGPFANVDKLVDRMFRDLLGRVPNGLELAFWRGELNKGANTPGGMVAKMVGDGEYQGTVAGVIRLYKAYFKRLPDEGGLTYWVGKVRGGTTLTKASATFAASSEFVRTYGSLSNTAFVKLVYSNVLGRQPDSGGLNYWVKKLNAGLSRGAVMIGFSESSEYTRKMTSTVGAVGVSHSLVLAIPSASALAATVARLDGGTALSTIVQETMESLGYLKRFGYTPPGPMGTPAAIPGVGEVTVRWLAPTASSSAPVTGYVVTPYKGGVAQTPINVGSGILGTTLTGLDGTASYTFTVASKSMFGVGTPSALSDAETPSAAVAPATYQVNPRHDGRAATALAATPTVKWSKTLDNQLSYPITANGRVFVTVAGNGSGGYGTRVYAYDAATGDLAWGPVAVTGTYYISGLSYEDHKVFVVGYSGLLMALDEATGAKKWSVNLPGQYSFTSPPTSYRGVLYTGGAGSGGTLYAVDEQTGTVLWTKGVANGDHSAPAVDAAGVYVSYACARSYRFDPQSGEQAWVHTTGCSGGGGKTPVLAAGGVYVRDGSSSVLLDKATGNTLSSFTSTFAPAIEGNTRFEVTAGVARAVEISTGNVLWSTTTATDGTIVTAPIVVDGAVVLGNSTGAVVGRNPVTGAVLWSASAGVAIDTPDEHNAWNLTGMTAGSGRLFVSAGDKLVAIA